MNNYYTFYLIETFEVSVSEAQINLFYFMGASSVGALGGGLIWFLPDVEKRK